jgi:integrase/recombinase XerD
MTGQITALAGDYIELRRGLGYRSPSRERALRAFARHLGRGGHDGAIPLERTLDWAASTASPDPCNPGPAAGDGAWFPAPPVGAGWRHRGSAPGLLGPAGHRRPPHVYSDREISGLLQAAAGLAPPGGLRPHSYATLFGLIACTGLRISEALALTCGDVDLDGGILTVRAGKRGRTRLIPLHPTALPPMRDYAAQRRRTCGPPGDGDAFFRTDRSDRISYSAASSTFIALRRQLTPALTGVG